MQDHNNTNTFGSFMNYPLVPPLYPPYTLSQNFPWQNTPGYATSFLKKLGSELTELTKMLDDNTRKLISTVKQCEKLDNFIEEANVDLAEKIMSKAENKEARDGVVFSQPNEEPFQTRERLVAQIFHREKFKYKLKLSHQRIPKLIYKDRKLTFRVKLVNPDGSPICNVNLIHLCVGACHANGEWILKEDGELFMGGKIEVDLYHGDAEFKRIFPSDISRRYSADPIKVIIYPKGSILKFSHAGEEHEREINPDEIEPLVINNVTVKAKKKN